MPILNGYHNCSECKKGVSWKCFVKNKLTEMAMGTKKEDEKFYEPKVLSAPAAKVHVLCFICPECGNIDIVKEKNHSTHNPYNF